MEFTLKVTSEEVDTIGKALAELPFKSVSGLLNKLQIQVNEQLAASAAPAEDSVEAEVKSKKK